LVATKKYFAHTFYLCPFNFVLFEEVHFVKCSASITKMKSLHCEQYSLIS